MVAKPTSLSTTTSTSSRGHTRSIERPAYSPTEPFFFKELQLTKGPSENPDGSQTEPSGRGYFPGAFNGADATVKDSKRFADTGGWGYFNFNHREPKALTAKVKDKSECAFCHIASAKRDEVWTQFYRILDEVPLPQGGRG